MQENKGGWVYIMSNRPNGVIYTGVTNNLGRRVWEHQEGQGGHFTKEHACKTRVWYVAFEDIREAINHEKRMKAWSREVKLKLIQKTNPTWQNLAETLNA